MRKPADLQNDTKARDRFVKLLNKLDATIVKADVAISDAQDEIQNLRPLRAISALKFAQQRVTDLDQMAWDVRETFFPEEPSVTGGTPIKPVEKKQKGATNAQLRHRKQKFAPGVVTGFSGKKFAVGKKGKSGRG